jgi:CDP-diacylglycerol--serine O-phosphatidyltransferase
MANNWRSARFAVTWGVYHDLMSTQKPKKPFSMIREFHLADWFTLGNAVCGTAAIFSTISFVQTEVVRHVYCTISPD